MDSFSHTRPFLVFFPSTLHPLPLCRRHAQTCPIGGNCTGGTTIDALPVATGYWRSSDNATDIQKCLVASVCVGGTYRDGRAVNTYAPVAFAVVGAGDALLSVCARLIAGLVGCISITLLHLH